jgi:error-prone DNA polymerase
LYEAEALQTVCEMEEQLPQLSLSEHVLLDYGATALSLKAHPISFIREKLMLCSILSANKLNYLDDGAMVKVAGLILVRQRPGTAKGICFITIEDETGVVNLVIFKKLFDKYRKEIQRAKLLMVAGTLQREGEVTHVIVKRCADMSRLLNNLAAEHYPTLPLSRADEKVDDVVVSRDKKNKQTPTVQGDIFHSGRNFK